MISRLTGAGLGLLAFAVSVLAGLSVGNPPVAVLFRGIVALFVFFVIGALLGVAAQRVLQDHKSGRERSAASEELKNRAEPADSRNGSTLPDSA